MCVKTEQSLFVKAAQPLLASTQWGTSSGHAAWHAVRRLLALR